MKYLLGLLAAILLAGAPVQAMTQDDTATEAAADEAAMAGADAAVAVEAPAVHTVTLKDGATVVTLEGDSAFMVDAATGSKLPAPDGDHLLADDTVMTVLGGKVVSGMPSFAAEGEAVVTTDEGAVVEGEAAAGHEGHEGHE